MRRTRNNLLCNGRSTSIAGEFRINRLEFQSKQDAFHREFESGLREATAAVGGRENVDLIVAEVIYHTDAAETVDVSAAMIEEMNGEAGETAPLHAPQP